MMPRRKDAVFYTLYFQEPGVAEAELERDVRQTFLKILGGGSVADGLRERPVSGPISMVPREGNGAKVAAPALYMVGDRDFIMKLQGMDQIIANSANNVPRLRDKVILADCGHWTQQERASEVNAAMIDFLRVL